MEELDPNGGWLAGEAKFIRTRMDTEYPPEKVNEVLSSLERQRDNSFL